MALSIVEFAAIGLLGYGAVGILLTCIVREAPADRSWAVLRILLIVPGIWALWFLASPGPLDDCAVGADRSACVPAIVLSEVTQVEKTKVYQTVTVTGNATCPGSSAGLEGGGGGGGGAGLTCVYKDAAHLRDVGQVERTEVDVIYLHSEAWWMWHWALGLILFIFVLVQAMQILVRP